MTAAAWRGRRVLVTGHTGFKGGWLCLWLKELGAEVTGFALPPATKPSLYDAAALGGQVDSVFGDIRDPQALAAIFRRVRPEAVFHLAAHAIVRESYEDPVNTYDTNVMGLVRVLEEVRREDATKAVIVVTSDKCYENREWVWPYREVDAMGGYDPYSSSKGCAELVVAAYRRSFFGAGRGQHRALVASARAGNVIGGGDWAAYRLIPDFVQAMTRGEAVKIRNPAAVRPWQHVLEPLSGYLALGERLLAGDAGAADAFNFGPHQHDARNVRWVVERMARHWGGGAGWEPMPGEHPHEAMQLRLDASKALHELGWQPRWELDTALRMVVDWYQAHARGGDMRKLTLEQIRCFSQA